jgi:hypothetical protein
MYIYIWVAARSHFISLAGLGDSWSAKKKTMSHRVINCLKASSGGIIMYGRLRQRRISSICDLLIK